MSTTAFSGDQLRRGPGHFETIALDELITLSFINKDDGRFYPTLTWKRTLKQGETYSSSLTSGRGVAPQEGFIYFWEDSKKIFWFADSEILQKVDLSEAAEGSSKSTNCRTKCYRHYDDLPEDLILLLQSLVPSP